MHTKHHHQLLHEGLSDEEAAPPVTPLALVDADRVQGRLPEDQVTRAGAGHIL